MHFAVQLAETGNRVYFVNPPRSNNSKTLATIHEQEIRKNIKLIDLKLIKGNLFFRYKLPFVYKIISDQYIKAIKKLVSAKIDELWCFNPHDYFNLKNFNAEKTLLLLYDFYKGKYISEVAKSADAIISVSQLILDHYKNTQPPKLLLQHGLGEYFAEIARTKLMSHNTEIKLYDKPKIGYMGNLLIKGLNRELIIKLIKQYPDNEFHFWGPYTLKGNNLTADTSVNDEISKFINLLTIQKNVILHGVKDHATLATEILIADLFILVYDIKNEMNKVSNSHKILEYLSTGKVIISTFVSNYSGSDLLFMTEPGRDDQFPEIFNTVINNLTTYNSIIEQRKRISFALDNTYKRQVERIENFLYHSHLK